MMIITTNSFNLLFSLAIIILMMIVCCSSKSSTLLNHLRSHKTISFQSQFSSPTEINLKKNSKFELKCSFLSNFDKIDIFWLHNGTLINSFISQNRIEKENINSFLGVSIVSRISIEKLHFDLNGYYQCIGVHQEIYAQQTFYVHLNTNETSSIETDFSKDALITVHTAQALFEPQDSISLMCRMNNYEKDKCKTEWFDPEDQRLNTLGENTDLVIQNGTFDQHMGLYTCQICCSHTCQKLTSFVYPAAQEDK